MAASSPARRRSRRSPAAAPAPAPSRRDEARALFRNAILDAAEGVFSERGFHVARCQDIAERARIAVGTIYNHFGQKEDVLAALIDERSAALSLAFRPRSDDPKDFEARLVRRVERFLEYVTAHRGFFALAIEHGLLGAATATAQQITGRHKLGQVARFKATIRSVVGEGMREGALRRVDEDLVARFFGSTLRAVIMRAVDSGSTGRAGAARAEPREDARMVVSLFLHGAGAPRRGRARQATNSSRSARRTSSSA